MDKPGVKTSEFYVVVIGAIASVLSGWLGKEFPVEAFALLATYVAGRAGEKVVRARKG
tara:strand:+ start:2934 stop:3107 length:174 start_codon:yes stop_codon:yes gene_type:complete